MQEKLTQSGQLTPAPFNKDEKWEATMGKDKFILNGKQAQLLKDATSAGQRGMVWFDGLAISIPHIVSIKRVVDSDEAKQKQERLKSVEEKKKELGIT